MEGRAIAEWVKMGVTIHRKMVAVFVYTVAPNGRMAFNVLVRVRRVISAAAIGPAPRMSKMRSLGLAIFGAVPSARGGEAVMKIRRRWYKRVLHVKKVEKA